MIERKIVIGLITSTEFNQQIQNIWDASLLESATARMIAEWCTTYYEKYKKAIGRNIESVYYQKLQENKIAKDIAEEIETEILPGLSSEYEENGINISYLVDETKKHLNEQKLLQFSRQIQTLVEQGELTEAEKLAGEYKTLARETGMDLDLNSDEVLIKLENAFTQTSSSVVVYPRQLGEFWNNQFVRGKLVALMGIEKRGKTWWLMDIAIRAARQKRKVVFFQAGDMTEKEQLMRIAIHLTRKSNLDKYSGKMFQPVKDCIYNQLDTCDKEIRECDFGIFEGRTEKEVRQEITIDELKEQYKDNPDYLPCSNCRAYKYKHIGTAWIEEVNTGNPLTLKEAQEAYQKFFIQNNRYFKLSSHANDTLSVKEIKALLDVWERDGFIPELVVIDYADLLVPDDSHIEFRHQQNKIWKGLRRISQEKNEPLVLTATQADAAGYVKNRLGMGNFSEDKRKYGHATIIFGLNQDIKEREKEIGIMRINKIAAREGYFSSKNEVHVLQNLKRGRPFLGSYY